MDWRNGKLAEPELCRLTSRSYINIELFYNSASELVDTYIFSGCNVCRLYIDWPTKIWNGFCPVQYKSAREMLGLVLLSDLSWARLGWVQGKVPGGNSLTCICESVQSQCSQVWSLAYHCSPIAGVVSCLSWVLANCNNALILTMGQCWPLLSKTTLLLQYQTLHNNCTSMASFFQQNVRNSHLQSARIPEERVELTSKVMSG